MVKEIGGELNASAKKFAIVVSRFNDFLTAKLKDGAIDCFVRHGAKEGDISVVWVLDITGGLPSSPLVFTEASTWGLFTVNFLLCSMLIALGTWGTRIQMKNVRRGEGVIHNY